MKTYIDTSVFGGFFDSEFSEPTKRFFDELDKDLKIPVISDMTIDEMQHAPVEVKQLFNRYTNNYIVLEVTEPIVKIAKAYIAEKGLTQKSLNDAIHIATASYYKIDVIVSWNFKHIVNLNRIRLFHAVNLKNGLPLIEIRTPLETLIF